MSNIYAGGLPDGVTTSYRSPLAAARRGLFYCEGTPNMFDASEDDFLLAIFLMYFAGARISEENSGSYDMQQMFPNPRTQFSELARLGWIEPTDARTAMEQAKSPELKALGATHGIKPLAGKKDDMIEKLLASMPEDALREYAAAHQFAIPSAKGFHVLRSLYNERAELELDVAAALHAGDDAFAVHLIEMHNQRRPMLPAPIISAALNLPRNTPIDCLVAALQLFTPSLSVVRQYAQFFTEHPDAVMHPGVKALFAL